MNSQQGWVLLFENFIDMLGIVIEGSLLPMRSLRLAQTIALSTYFLDSALFTSRQQQYYFFIFIISSFTSLENNIITVNDAMMNAQHISKSIMPNSENARQFLKSRSATVTIRVCKRAIMFIRISYEVNSTSINLCRKSTRIF